MPFGTKLLNFSISEKSLSEDSIDQKRRLLNDVDWFLSEEEGVLGVSRSH